MPFRIVFCLAKTNILSERRQNIRGARRMKAGRTQPQDTKVWLNVVDTSLKMVTII